MKPDYNRLAFFASLIVVVVLIAIGKLPYTALTALLAAGGFGAWLLPSPVGKKDSHADGVDDSPEDVK